MSEMTLDLSNLGLEFDLISYSLKTGALPEGLNPGDFAGTKSRWIAEKLAIMGSSCSIPLLVSELNREGKTEEVEEYEALLSRLLGQDIRPEIIPEVVGRLKELSSGRRLANILSQPGGVADKLQRQKVTEAIGDLERFLFAQHSLSGMMDEGSFIADEVSLLAAIELARQQEEFAGCPTYINELDEVIFGLLPGEFGLLVGGTGEGKSLGLLDIGMRNWELGGKNVIFFSIEMNKQQQEFRQLAWACDIDIHRFRTGDITQEEMVRIKRFFELRRERQNQFFWVDIPENINAVQIEKKILQAERKLDCVFDMVLIDYVGIMSPIGKFDSRMNWDAQAEIAWNVHNLARKTKKVVWSAAQKKENISDKEKQRGGLKAIGLSYMIAQPADIVLIFIEKTLEGFMEVNVAKGRDVPKDKVKLRPDLRHAKLHRLDEEQRAKVSGMQIYPSTV